MILPTITWACAAMVAFTYFGYPSLVRILSIIARPKARAEGSSTTNLPGLSLLIAAHNEQSCIHDRIENALALDYPADKLEIVIASDGSRDRTCEIVRSFTDVRVRLLDFSPNKGKSTTLNRAVPETNGEIIVFSDANTMFAPDALRKLLAHFADPKVGVVVGRLVLQDPATGKNVDGLYWRYETFIKRSEARLGALLGANGAIYAMRRDYYVPIPGNTIVDDFVIPLLAKLRHGCQIVYEPDAVAIEETPPHVGAEFRRRARIGAGGYQSLTLLWPLLSPRYGWTAFAFFSHKVLRWMVPFLLIAMFVSNLFLLDQTIYQWTLAGQVALIVLSAVGMFVPGGNIASRSIRLLTMFSGMNLALLVGFWRWVTTRQTGTWTRTAR